MVILCGGTMDIARNNSRHGLASISRFAENLVHTNVVVVEAPHRFDLDSFPCVNKEVKCLQQEITENIKTAQTRESGKSPHG